MIIRPLIALYGGSFDPVHNGHIALANHVMRDLSPDILHVIPCFLPPHKAPLKASDAQRLDMLKIVFSEVPNVFIDEREFKRGAVSYSYHTVFEIRRELGEGAAIYWLVGMDSWSNFTSWYRWRDILALVNVLVVNRPHETSPLATDLADYQTEHQIDLEQKRDFAQGKVVHLSMPEQDVASSTVREKLTRREDVSTFVPFAVANYIRDHQLYLGA